MAMSLGLPVTVMNNATARALTIAAAVHNCKATAGCNALNLDFEHAIRDPVKRLFKVFPTLSMERECLTISAQLDALRMNVGSGITRQLTSTPADPAPVCIHVPAGMSAPAGARKRRKK